MGSKWEPDKRQTGLLTVGSNLTSPSETGDLMDIPQWRRVGGWFEMAASLGILRRQSKSRKVVARVINEAEGNEEDTAD
jgi:hypothetical protein